MIEGFCMLRPSASVQVYLYAGAVDMRKSINGLSALIEQELELNPMINALFVFCNRNRDKVKLLYWERNGFVLWYKRLEKQRFKWLKPTDTASLCIDGYQLNLLLDGLDIFNNKPHETLFYSAIN
ncbi:transposase [Thalassolituus oleivorans R6-15]|jgi:transposase|nr:IS66 family insertion sequence element accessory protein TnpB [Sphingobium sp. C100]AHK15537.1 transposase [Thalassolituus oleivorans R6-15]AHK16489.1 transposase [Thalassolituus oleivorans R6-15]ETI64211.1 transposase [Sphingobium sp. C100]|tara:strand:- start:1731 stop:2105 length:375 start_codon:yes stop_codon:yes gene_type:complete